MLGSGVRGDCIAHVSCRGLSRSVLTTLRAVRLIGRWEQQIKRRGGATTARLVKAVATAGLPEMTSAVASQIAVAIPAVRVNHAASGSIAGLPGERLALRYKRGGYRFERQGGCTPHPTTAECLHRGIHRFS